MTDTVANIPDLLKRATAALKWHDTERGTELYQLLVETVDALESIHLQRRDPIGLGEFMTVSKAS